MSLGSVERAVEQAEAGLRALTGLDPIGLTGVEVLELNQAAQRLRTLADAVCVRAAAALDSSGAWAPEGAKSPHAWLQWRCGLSRGRAGAVLRGARDLREMPATEAALMAGRITVDHVRLLADARRVSPDAFTDEEPRLVDAAGRLRVTQLHKALTYWTHLHEPDLVERTAQEVHESRELSASRSLDDVVIIDAVLDPVGGAIFLRELERLEQSLWEADWAEARDRLGTAACEQDLAAPAANAAPTPSS